MFAIAVHRANGEMLDECVTSDVQARIVWWTGKYGCDVVFSVQPIYTPIISVRQPVVI